MTQERYEAIMEFDEELTEEECKEGWHFCLEFDGLLVKGDPTKEYCGKECIDWDWIIK